MLLRFASSPIQIIIYVWFNDENTLRKAGAKTDLYETFKRMLARGWCLGSRAQYSGRVDKIHFVRIQAFNFIEPQ